MKCRRYPRYWDTLTILDLKFDSPFYHLLMCLKYCCMYANIVDQHHTPRSVASDLGLHCFQRPYCPNS